MTHTPSQTTQRLPLPEQKRDVTRSVRSLNRTMWGGLSALGIGLTGLNVAPAQADTLPRLSAACFTYTPGHETPNAHSLSSTGFHAELTGTGLSLNVASSKLADSSQKLDAEGLSRVNAATAYGALLAYHHGMTPSCAGQPIPETDEVKHTTPEATWSNVTLSRAGDKDQLVKTIHLKIVTSSPSIRARFEASGLPAGHALLPSSITGDIDFQPAPHPPYTVTIHDLKTSFSHSAIEGHGIVQVAPTLQTSQATLHLTASHIGSLIDQAGTVAPAQVTGSLLIARMMSKREGDHLTGWDIQMKGGKMFVNGISIPIPTH